MTTTFENPNNGYRVSVNGFSSFIWTSIFGPLYFLARGNTRHFFLGLLLAGLVIPWLIYPFFAASILRTMYYERGMRVVDTPASSGSSAIALIFALLLLSGGVFFVIHIATQHDDLPPQIQSRITSSTPPAKPAADKIDSSDSPIQVRRATVVSESAPPPTPLRPEPTVAVALQIFYSVTGVAAGDTLNVRSGPGSNYDAVQKLPNGYNKIQIIGAPVMNDTTEWVHITFGNQSGWVRKQYLNAQ